MTREELKEHCLKTLTWYKDRPESKQYQEHCLILLLLNKTECTPLDMVLDKIKAEINKLPDLNPDHEMDKTIHVSKWAVFDIIDKYKVESEDKR